MTERRSTGPRVTNVSMMQFGLSIEVDGFLAGTMRVDSFLAAEEMLVLLMPDEPRERLRDLLWKGGGISLRGASTVGSSLPGGSGGGG